MTREILTWIDRKMDDLDKEESISKMQAKVFGLGILDGLIDSFVIAGAVASVAGIIAGIKNRKQ